MRTWQTINRDLQKKLSRNVRRLRSAEDFSVEDASARVPWLSARHWQRIEAGDSTNVKIETLAKIAAALGVDPLDLLR